MMGRWCSMNQWIAKQQIIKTIRELKTNNLGDGPRVPRNKVIDAINRAQPKATEEEVTSLAKVLIRCLNEALKRPLQDCEIPESWESWEALDNYPAAQAWWKTVASTIIESWCGGTDENS